MIAPRLTGFSQVFEFERVDLLTRGLQRTGAGELVFVVPHRGAFVATVSEAIAKLHSHQYRPPFGSSIDAG